MYEKFSIGQLCEMVRRLHGLTQIEFAQKLNVVQSTVSKIESDIWLDVPFSYINSVSNIFDIPIRHFQDGYLTFKSSSKFKKAESLLPERFINDHKYSSQTIFSILNSINEISKGCIFKKLRLRISYFCAIELRFSDQIIIELYKHVRYQLLEIIQEEMETKEVETVKEFTQILNLIEKNYPEDYSYWKSSIQHLKAA